MGTWFWLNIPLAAVIFLAVTGIPLWMVFRHPDERRAPAMPSYRRSPSPTARRTAPQPRAARDAAPRPDTVRVSQQRVYERV
jgi:hypothetical protein